MLTYTDKYVPKKNVSFHDSEKRIEVIVISCPHLLNSHIQVNGHPHDLSESPIQNLQKLTKKQES